MAARTWYDKMDRLLVTCRDTFGRTAEDPRGQITYRRTGYADFVLTGIFDIDHRLENVNQGQYYAVNLRLKDFDGAPFSASITVQFDNLPNNGSNVTFDGVTYTFRTAINNAVAREVLRGATAVECAANLTVAINAGAGAGVKYSSATTEHPTCSAVQDSQYCVVSYDTAGTAGNNIVATESLYAARLIRRESDPVSTTVFTGGGALKNDLVIIDGLTYRISDIGYDPEGLVTLRVELKTV